MNFNDALIKLGFSPIESTIYTTLCKHGALTGYEVAKLCNISRSNVYSSLYNLQEKGICHVSEGESTKYIPITKSELLALARSTYSDIIHSIEHQFPESITASEPYITIKGYDNVIQKVRHAILNCNSHLYLLASFHFIDFFKSELEEAGHSKRITLLCDKPLHLTHVKSHLRAKEPQGFHMIIDTQLVITGELLDTTSQCLYTNNLSLVRMMRESFITELDMIQFYNQTNLN